MAAPSAFTGSDFLHHEAMDMLSVDADQNALIDVASHYNLASR
jgi:hypothetical protein